jgi:putative YphP/YqiW family bacilliredoxin
MYDERFIAPMRAELTDLGVQELKSVADVDAALKNAEGTTLVVVNSMCGCAARNARPAIKTALEHTATPDKSVTVFAGQDPEPTQAARGYLTGFRPSSPSIALMKAGKVVFMLERHQIEGRTAHEISHDLVGAFDTYCG